jgi:hypothetical protein
MTKILVAVGLLFTSACFEDRGNAFRTASQVTSAIEQLPGTICAPSTNSTTCVLPCMRLQVTGYRTGSGLVAAGCH